MKNGPCSTIQIRRGWLSPGEIPEPQPMPEVHQKKAMLGVWWDMKGIIYYELLESHQTVTAERYNNNYNV